MADREKLIELLESAESAFYWDSSDKGFVEKIADHLIANGVMFKADAEDEIRILKQKRANIFEILDAYERGKRDAFKWIPVTERLPEEEDADEHDCVLVHTSNRDNLIVAREAVWKCTEFMTHWQPLHEPPKGE